MLFREELGTGNYLAKLKTDTAALDSPSSPIRREAIPHSTNMSSSTTSSSSSDDGSKESKDRSGSSGDGGKSSNSSGSSTGNKTDNNDPNDGFRLPPSVEDPEDDSGYDTDYERPLSEG
ncbi:hypothetical protein F4776DRAFT_663374 [Hypoxylon sp. NC0597]|nr:hypothetical protein F4776DRAFT_663374 [Hypoxylon sp. NC0597]